ncbi:hypothetical protein [Bacillus pumilus]|nr:hypothetical protein [Bacillus pumilus]
MAWKIDTKGVNGESEDEMRKDLEEMGVEKGGFELVMGRGEKIEK